MTHKSRLLSLMAFVLMAGASMSPIAQAQQNPSANDTPQKRAKYDKAKERGNGILGELLGDVLSTGSLQKHLPPGSNVPAPGADMPMPNSSAEKIGADVLVYTACYDIVRFGTMTGATLEQTCGDAIMKPTGLSPSGTAISSDLILATCGDLVRLQRAPGTKLEKHCVRIVSAYKMMQEQMAKREAARAGANTGVNVTDRSRPGVSQNDLTNAYSACTVENKQVGTASSRDETCVFERLPQPAQSCTKQLSVQVRWSCPAGVVLSGPTRVSGATATADGHYTCQMQEPREVYSCPAGSTGPSVMPIPPGNQSGQACRNNTTSVVSAAIRTVVNDTVTRDATHTDTDNWGGNCGTLEANTPGEYRSPATGRAVGIWPAFNTAPNSPRCRIRESTCTDAPVGARAVNDALVTRSCWAATELFDCVSTEVTSMCKADSNCTEKPGTETCENWDPYSSPPSCLTRSVTRSCTTAPPADRQVNNCETQTFCVNGMCNDVGHKADQDFDSVVSYLNSGAQAGRYFAAQDFEVFKGYPGSCRHIYGGLINCCEKSWLRDFLLGGFFVLENFKFDTDEEKKHSSAGKAATDDTTDEHGKKMQDKNVQSGLYTQENLRLVAAGARAVNTLKATASDVWRDIKEGDKGAVVWDFVWKMPHKLGKQCWNAVLDAVTWVMTFGGVFDQCEDHEQTLVKKKNADLCIAVGSRCSEKFFGISGTCWQRSYNFCCFPSILGKLINEGGRKQIKERNPQIGQSLFDGADGIWGDMRNPNCTGFKMEQFKTIKLNEINLGPFIASIRPNLPSRDDIVAAATGMYANCKGGSAQCDTGTPYVSAKVEQGKRDGTNAGVMTADQGGGPPPMTDAREQLEKRQTLTERDKAIINEKQFISLRPLLLQAFNTGSATGTVNNEDIKLFSKWRFRKDNIPVTVDIKSAGNASDAMRGDARFAGKACKYMVINMKRPQVTTSWVDTNVWDPKLKMWRPPGVRPSSDGENWVAASDLAGEQPESHDRTFAGWESASTMIYCSDGTTNWAMN